MKYRRRFDAIEKMPNHSKRGTAFEKLINLILEENELLISHRYRTEGNTQEIDGAIFLCNRVFLLEVKWEESETLAASKLFSFLGKINSKLEGTLGLFISYNKLSKNFIDGFRNGIKHNCILVHGQTDIMNIIDEKVNIADYLQYCYEQASIKGRVYIETSEFIAMPPSPKIGVRNIPPDKWYLIYNSLINNDSLSDFAAIIETNYSADLELSKKILNIYKTLKFDSIVREKLNLLIRKLAEEEQEKLIKSLVAKYKSENWRNYSDEQLTNLLKELKLEIEQVDRNAIVNNLKQAFFKGDWELENDASRVLDIFYDKILLEEYELLAPLYLEIYLDKIRKDKFVQKQFANRLFNDIKRVKGEYFTTIENQLVDILRDKKSNMELFREADTPEEDEHVKKHTKKDFIEATNRVFIENKKDGDSFFETEYPKL